MARCHNLDRILRIRVPARTRSLQKGWCAKPSCVQAKSARPVLLTVYLSKVSAEVSRFGWRESALAPGKVLQQGENYSHSYVEILMHWKCVLGMSDLQIVTGIAILVSGYASLHCGISAYHWQLIVYLAWFSSVTHLSALTFLRNYLYNRLGERLWRLISMSAFLCMLIVALAPTGSFDWQGLPSDVSPVVSPSTYAICHFAVPDCNDLASTSASLSYGSMVMSILLLVFGFISRVFKLYEPLFALVSSWRANISKGYRTWLWKFQVWSGPNTHPFNWRKTLVHRPAVSVFLVLRLYLDIYSSMFFEVRAPLSMIFICLLENIQVYWLLVSIIWGTIQLLNTRSSTSNPSDSEWTFGQVLAVVLLACPLMAIIENLYPGK